LTVPSDAHDFMHFFQFPNSDKPEPNGLEDKN